VECIRTEKQSGATAYRKYGCRCPECCEANTQMGRDWRRNSPEKYREHATVHAKKKRAYIQSKKLGRGCSVCGYDRNAAALHLHHPDPSKKVAKNLVGLSWDAIEAEFEKCEILCSNCHSELHHPNMDEGTH
jgi:hypothetical protein